MRNKRTGIKITIVLLTGILLLGLWGCSLAVETGDGERSQDELIGAVVTRDYVEKTYAHVNWSEKGIESLELEGIEGYYFLYTILDGENGTPVHASRASDGLDCQFHYAMKNEEKSSVEGNANISIIPGEDNTVYLNPIYMTADKEVYVAPGNSLEFGKGMEVGNGSLGHTLSSEKKVSSGDSEIKESVKLTVEFELAYEPVKIRFSEKDENHNLIKMTEFDPKEVPDHYTPQQQTAYILVETERIGADGEFISSREICSWDGSETTTDNQTGDQPVEKKCTTFKTPYSEENGFVLNKLTQVMWP